VIAGWTSRNTEFDRLYFYDETRPFHISVGPERTGQIIVMRPRKSNPALLFPHIVQPSYFDTLILRATE
jgi:hypothetical protein